MKKNLLLYLILLKFVLFIGCTTDNNSDPSHLKMENAPTLSAISHSSKVQHMPAFIFTAIGSNFVENSKIVFNGVEKDTTFVSDTKIVSLIGPEDLSLNSVSLLNGEEDSNIQDKNLQVLVRNPFPGGESEIKYFTIFDNYTFYPPINQSNSSGKSFNPDIVSDGNEHLYVVWHEVYDRYAEIFFSYSSNQGKSWGEPVNISDTPEFSSSPSIDLSPDGDILVVWRDTIHENDEIFFKKSRDNGQSWTSAVNVSDSTTNSGSPEITADMSGNLLVVWNDGTYENQDIYFSRSTDTGRTWSHPVKISCDNEISVSSDIAVSSTGMIFVVWYQNRPGSSTFDNSDIFFSRSDSNGTDWSVPQNIPKVSDVAIRPVVKINSKDHICVAWVERISGSGYGIFFSRSSNNGKSWLLPVNVSNNLGKPTTVDMEIDEADNINLVWNDKSIFYIRSIDNGSSWSEILDVVGDSNGLFLSVYSPMIDMNREGNLYIVWRDDHDDDIFFSASSRGPFQ